MSSPSMSETFVVPKSLPHILVVDDEPMMHDVFRVAFDEMYQVDGYCNGDDALEAASLLSYQVAIVDLKMESMGGIQVLKALKKISPFTQVILLTGHACMESAILAVNLGAFRYLHKPFQLQQLRRAVAEAFSRYSVESSALSELTTESLAAAGIAGRKAEVVVQVLQYKSTKEIAKSMQVSPRTIEKHLEFLFSLLGASSRLEMIAKIKALLRGALVVWASFGITGLDDVIALFA